MRCLLKIKQYLQIQIMQKENSRTPLGNSRLDSFIRHESLRHNWRIAHTLFQRNLSGVRWIDKKNFDKNKQTRRPRYAKSYYCYALNHTKQMFEISRCQSNWILCAFLLKKVALFFCLANEDYCGNSCDAKFQTVCSWRSILLYAHPSLFFQKYFTYYSLHEL